MTDTDLLPCPWCGGEDQLTVDLIAGDDWSVECERCHVGQHAIWPSKYHAIAKWNTRTPSSTRALDTQTPAGDAEFQNDICTIVSEYGVKDIYDATTEILICVEKYRPSAALAGKPKDGPVYTNAEFTINQHRQEIPVYDTLSGPVPDTTDNAKRGDNTAADTKMGDAVKALAAIENGTLVLDVMHTYECGSRHTGDCVCGAEENSKHITTIKKALSHDNAELGKVGEIFDKLTQYAEDSIGCQYGTLSADLVEKLAKEGLAIIDRLMGVKG